MRTLLRRIGARTGVSLGLIVVVAMVVIVARLAADGRTPAPVPRISDALPTVPATNGDDGVDGVDGIDDDEPDSYPDDPAVLAAAAEFTTAWLRRTLPAQEWLDGLRPLATEDLVERLAGVDPLDVPSGTSLGEPTIRARSDVYADVLVPIAQHDALALGLALDEGRWRVATLDRETG
jgi:hypothetical protein